MNNSMASGYYSLQRIVFYKMLKHVSCEYDRWVVEPQLCKLCDTPDTLIGRSCSIPGIRFCDMVFVN